VFLRGRSCGFVEGDVFYRPFDSKKHVLRRLGDALSFHLSVLKQLRGVVWICAIDEREREHWLRLADLIEFGKETSDPDFGEQIALPLHRWFSARADGAPFNPEDEAQPLMEP